MALPRGRRVIATLPVSIDGRAAALSTDVSKEGFCLESPTLLGVGTEVSGVVMHGTLKLAFTGRVAWARPSDPMACTFHRMGVQFEQLSPGLRALLGLALR